MRISFDLDDTLIPAELDPKSGEGVMFPFSLFYRERLRQGTRALCRELEKLGCEICIYTSSERPVSYIRNLFRLHGIGLCQVINNREHLRIVQGDRNEIMPAKVLSKFNIDLHVDDDATVAQNAVRQGVDVLIVSPDDPDWADKVIAEAKRVAKLKGKTLRTERESADVYDPATGKVTRIPKCELAPGMVKAVVEGMEGEYWIDANKLCGADGFRHPPFDDEIRELVEEIRGRLKEVRPKTYKEWEDGFRKDADPEKEIAIWLTFARKFSAITGQKQYSPAQKKDIYTILTSLMLGGKDAEAICGKVSTLSRDDIDRIMKEFPYYRKNQLQAPDHP